MTVHQCTGEGYPPGGVTCICARGVDHDEEQFDVPVSDGDV